MKQLKKFQGIISLAIFGLFFFGFPAIEKPVIEFAQVWINNLGIFAPIGYIIVGIISTVIAPIGLGPLNIVLQRAFGFWPSVLYFWIYITIGISINFLLSTLYGTKIIKYLFYLGDEKLMKVDPLTKLSTFMLNKSYFSAFVCMLGFGGELIGYLAGLSKLSYLKFLSIIVFTNLINSLLFVGSNLTIGTNNNLFIGLNVANFMLTTLPLVIVFRKEILHYFKNLISKHKISNKQQQIFKQEIEQYKSGKVSFEDFNIIYINYVKKQAQNDIDMVDAIMPGIIQNSEKHKYIFESIKDCNKQIKKILPLQDCIQLYKNSLSLLPPSSQFDKI